MVHNLLSFKYGCLRSRAVRKHTCPSRAKSRGWKCTEETSLVLSYRNTNKKLKKNLERLYPCLFPSLNHLRKWLRLSQLKFQNQLLLVKVSKSTVLISYFWSADLVNGYSLYKNFSMPKDIKIPNNDLSGVKVNQVQCMCITLFLLRTIAYVNRYFYTMDFDPDKITGFASHSMACWEQGEPL